MRIETTTRAAARALADYLMRCECSVDFVTDCALEVSPPGRLQTPRETEIEIEAYLRVWQALHPGEGSLVSTITDETDG